MEKTKSNVSREEQMVVLASDENGKPTVWCDPEIVWLVKLLNDGGLPTIASCSGHGNVPPSVVLKDERVLVVLDDLDALARVNDLYSADINGEAVVDPKDAEIARLRELVEESYCEGFTDGQFTDSFQTTPAAWEASKSRQTLEQNPQLAQNSKFDEISRP